MIFPIRNKFNGKTDQYSIDDNFGRFQKLTSECELFGETGNSYGYINTVGKRVWVPKSRCKKVEVIPEKTKDDDADYKPMLNGVIETRCTYDGNKIGGW